MVAICATKCTAIFDAYTCSVRLKSMALFHSVCFGILLLKIWLAKHVWGQSMIIICLSSARTLCWVILYMMTLWINSLFTTLSINNTKYTWHGISLYGVPLCWKSWCWVLHFSLCYTECNFVECCGALCNYHNTFYLK